jgi:hypothetical protein
LLNNRGGLNLTIQIVGEARGNISHGHAYFWERCSRAN